MIIISSHILESRSHLLALKELVQKERSLLRGFKKPEEIIFENDEFGNSPLHHFATIEDLAPLKYLLVTSPTLLGAINQENNSGQTPLEISLQKGNKMVARFLLENGAQIKDQEQLKTIQKVVDFAPSETNYFTPSKSNPSAAAVEIGAEAGSAFVSKGAGAGVGAGFGVVK